jgi:hypothetical protein
MITRLFFIGEGRIDDAIQTLKHDRMISDIKKTIIYYGPQDTDTDWIILKLKEKGIDTKTFSVYNDAVLRNKQETDIVQNFYKHGGWVAQQIIKLLALDSCEDENILIQDCDTYLLKPHNFFYNDVPVPMVIEKQTQHPDYYLYIEKILNIKRQTEDSFVTEFMPIRKNEWISLVKNIEKIHSKQWLKAIYDILQSAKSGPITMFSEYEFLGNWQLYCNPTMKTKSQIRFHSDKIDLPVNTKYNAYCIKPDDTWKMYE